MRRGNLSPCSLFWQQQQRRRRRRRQQQHHYPGSEARVLNLNAGGSVMLLRWRRRRRHYADGMEHGGVPEVPLPPNKSSREGGNQPRMNLTAFTRHEWMPFLFRPFNNACSTARCTAQVQCQTWSNHNNVECWREGRGGRGKGLSWRFPSRGTTVNSAYMTIIFQPASLLH